MQTGDVHSPRIPGLTSEYLSIKGFAKKYFGKIHYFALILSTMNTDCIDVLYTHDTKRDVLIHSPIQD